VSDIEKTLEEIGCNPLKLSAQLAMGKPVNTPHSDLPKIKDKWNKILVDIQDGEIKQSALDDFWGLIANALSVTKPSNEIQSKHIVSLTEYLHSKKKSIENVNRIEHFNSTEEMTDEMLESIIKGDDINIALDNKDDSNTGN